MDASGSSRLQELLAELPDEDTCAVCYGVCCRPASYSDQCNHTFCRLCVFKARSTGNGCPLCRAPVGAAVEEAVLPCEIPFNKEAADAMQRAHGELYSAALLAEEATEARLRERVVPLVPLVLLPGQCPKGHRPKVAATMTLHFTETEAIQTILANQHGQVGFLYREENDSGTAYGFLARIKRVRFVCAWRAQGSPSEVRATIAAQQSFQRVGRVKRDDEGGQVGAVEILPGGLP